MTKSGKTKLMVNDTPFDEIFMKIFSALTLAECFLEYRLMKNWINFAKPFVMIVLIAYFWHRTEKAKDPYAKKVFYALIFSLLGDIALLNQYDETFFLLGVLMFMIAHIFYVTAFAQNIRESEQDFQPATSFIMSLPVIIYAFVLVKSIYYFLGDLKIPVLIYCAIIASMGILAIVRKDHTIRESYILTLIGAGLFIMSDSMLALWKFRQFRNHGLAAAIMMTYYFGQCFIVKGTIRHVLMIKSGQKPGAEPSLLKEE